MLCNFQIISGCVCHFEQLHAQSPFLFPIVFSINLIPFFDICSVLAPLSPGLFGFVLNNTWAAARSQLLLFVILAGGLVFRCGLPRQISPLPRITPRRSNRRVLQHTRPSTFRNPMLSANIRLSTSYKFAVPRSRLPCRLFRLSVEPRLSTALKDRSVVPWS